MSDSLWPHGLQPTRLLRPWGFPGKSTGVGCHRLLRYKVLYCIYWFINHRKYSFTLWCANSVLSHSSLFSSIQCMRLYIYFIFLFSLNYCHYYYQFYVFVVFCFQGQNSVGGKTKIFSKFWPCYAMLSHFSRVRLCVTPIDGSPTAPPSLGFSRQEHWSGLPFPSPMHESKKWKWSRSVVSDLVTPWTAAYQAPPSMGFSRQEYWSGVPLPSCVNVLS